MLTKPTCVTEDESWRLCQDTAGTTGDSQHRNHSITNTNLLSTCSTGFGEFTLVCLLKLLSSLAYGVLAIWPTGNFEEIESKNSCEKHIKIRVWTMPSKQNWDNPVRSVISRLLVLNQNQYSCQLSLMIHILASQPYVSLWYCYLSNMIVNICRRLAYVA